MNDAWPLCGDAITVVNANGKKLDPISTKTAVIIIVHVFQRRWPRPSSKILFVSIVSRSYRAVCENSYVINGLFSIVFFFSYLLRKNAVEIGLDSNGMAVDRPHRWYRDIHVGWL